MDSNQEKQYIFNMKLARIMGLYQILSPNSISIFGYNIYHIAIVFFESFMLAILMLFPIGTNNLIPLKEKQDILYNDLITIMTDHQNVLRKLSDFYNIFRSITLTQIFIASSSHVFIWFIAAMSIDEGDNADSILSFKLFIVLPLINFQLFMTCSLFGTINEKLHLPGPTALTVVTVALPLTRCLRSITLFLWPS
ncbi:hypothetical protein QTP88_017923 [Uroleucon formosanum]